MATLSLSQVKSLDESKSKSKSTGSEGSDAAEKKTCADCGTTRTPLWRGGPAGPKSLCNACGIRSRKKRRAIMGLNKSASSEKQKQKVLSMSFRSPFENKKLMRKLGEEEQAAVLLMALSYASVYA